MLFRDCSPWQLLNLTATTVLDIPARLTEQYGMSTSYIEQVMEDYIIQTVGKDKLMKEFGIEKQPQFFVSTTKHYSWPKGAGTHPFLPLLPRISPPPPPQP